MFHLHLFLVDTIFHRQTLAQSFSWHRKAVNHLFQLLSPAWMSSHTDNTQSNIAHIQTIPTQSNITRRQCLVLLSLPSPWPFYGILKLTAEKLRKHHSSEYWIYCWWVMLYHCFKELWWWATYNSGGHWWVAADPTPDPYNRHCARIFFMRTPTQTFIPFSRGTNLHIINISTAERCT